MHALYVIRLIILLKKQNEKECVCVRWLQHLVIYNITNKNICTEIKHYEEMKSIELIK